jgi:hypothetical protein
MAHFAEISADNTVLNVVVVDNDATTIDGVEDEQRGIDFLDDLLPTFGAWVQTSYNKTFRINYAYIGGTYDPTNDLFHAPQPFPSWTLDLVTGRWEPPTPMPDDGASYAWDEDTISWVEPE